MLATLVELDGKLAALERGMAVVPQGRLRGLDTASESQAPSAPVSPPTGVGAGGSLGLDGPGGATVGGLTVEATVAGLAGEATVAGLAGEATVAGLAGEATVAGLAGEATVAGLAGQATVRMPGVAELSAWHGRLRRAIGELTALQAEIELVLAGNADVASAAGSVVDPDTADRSPAT